MDCGRYMTGTDGMKELSRAGNDDRRERNEGLIARLSNRITAVMEPIDDGVHVRVHGELGDGGRAQLRTVLSAALLDHVWAVVELSGLRLTQSEAVTVFASALARAGGWPSARMVLVGADGRMKAALRSTAVDEFIGTASTVGEAHRLLGRRPCCVSREDDLPAGELAIELARELTRNACLAWDVLGLGERAEMAATELIDSVLVPLPRECTLRLTLTPAGLYVALYDPIPVGDAELRRMRIGNGPRSPLRPLTGIAADSGVHRHYQGKIVWVLLALP